MEKNSLVARATLYTVQFMRLAGLKCTYGETPNTLFSYTVMVTDLTEDGEPFGTNLVIDQNYLSTVGVDDSEESIEKFAHETAKIVGHGIFNEKCRRLLKFDSTEEAKRRLIVPG